MEPLGDREAGGIDQQASPAAAPDQRNKNDTDGKVFHGLSPVLHPARPAGVGPLHLSKTFGESRLFAKARGATPGQEEALVFSGRPDRAGVPE